MVFLRSCPISGVHFNKPGNSSTPPRRRSRKNPVNKISTRARYFRANIRLVENHCCVTGVTDIKHLRASHIKPWSVSNNEGKLDGNNGLLLSPHVDHLFDQGFISFEDKRELIVSDSLSRAVVDKWFIPIPKM
jgi:predicted restriction endonuclease